MALKNVVAFGAAAAIGAIVGFVVGYFAFIVPRGTSGGVSFSRYFELWLSGHSALTGAPAWGVVGAMIGIGLLWLSRFRRE